MVRSYIDPMQYSIRYRGLTVPMASVGLAAVKVPEWGADSFLKAL